MTAQLIIKAAKRYAIVSHKNLGLIEPLNSHLIKLCAVKDNGKIAYSLEDSD